MYPVHSARDSHPHTELCPVCTRYHLLEILTFTQLCPVLTRTPSARYSHPPTELCPVRTRTHSARNSHPPSEFCPVRTRTPSARYSHPPSEFCPVSTRTPSARDSHLDAECEVSELGSVRRAVRVRYEALLLAALRYHVHPVVLLVQHVHHLSERGAVRTPLQRGPPEQVALALEIVRSNDVSSL